MTHISSINNCINKENLLNTNLNTDFLSSLPNFVSPTTNNAAKPSTTVYTRTLLSQLANSNNKKRCSSQIFANGVSKDYNPTSNKILKEINMNDVKAKMQKQKQSAILQQQEQKKNRKNSRKPKQQQSKEIEKEEINDKFMNKHKIPSRADMKKVKIGTLKKWMTSIKYKHRPRMNGTRKDDYIDAFRQFK
eukprot:447755_1